MAMRFQFTTSATQKRARPLSRYHLTSSPSSWLIRPMLGSSMVMNTMVTQVDETATGMENRISTSFPPGSRLRHSAASSRAMASEGNTVIKTNFTETKQLFQNSPLVSNVRYSSSPQNETAWP